MRIISLKETNKVLKTFLQVQEMIVYVVCYLCFSHHV